MPVDDRSPDGGRRPPVAKEGLDAVEATEPGGGTGPAPPVVPHLVGHHIDVALRRLEALGLVARVVTTEFHDKSDRHVVSTSPAGGSLARRPIVEVIVGIAPAVADYVGRDLDEAVQAAERAGHVVEVVPARPPGGDHRDGTDTPALDGAAPATGLAVVVDQEPPAGERSRVLWLHAGPADPDGTDRP